MRVAIIGGTGHEGKGLAIRWAAAGLDVVLGSRDAARAAAVAAELGDKHGVKLSGQANAEAAAGADLVVLSVPYGGHAATLTALKPHLEGKILVDITVPLKPPKVRVVQQPAGRAAALEAQALLGEGVTVAAALHHVGAAHLQDIHHRIDCDVLVCCDSKAKRYEVMALIDKLGVRALDAGRLPNAVALESLTPVLIHMNKVYGSAGTGLRITGLPAAQASTD